MAKRKFIPVERPIYVMLACTQDKIDERMVKFIDIQEDIQGRDVLTFQCPKCNRTHTSLRFG